MGDGAGRNTPTIDALAALAVTFGDRPPAAVVLDVFSAVAAEARGALTVKEAEALRGSPAGIVEASKRLAWAPASDGTRVLGVRAGGARDDSGAAVAIPSVPMPVQELLAAWLAARGEVPPEPYAPEEREVADLACRGVWTAAVELHPKLEDALRRTEGDLTRNALAAEIQALVARAVQGGPELLEEKVARGWQSALSTARERVTHEEWFLDAVVVPTLASHRPHQSAAEFAAGHAAER